MTTQIFIDGADLADIEQYANDPRVAGFTTNPSLMKQAGVTYYPGFGQRATRAAQGKPISFEVVTEDRVEMERQAHTIQAWGDNVYVKIPCRVSTGQSTHRIVQALSYAGVQVNVTALMSMADISMMADSINQDTKGFLSVFAGRIADTGRDPVPFVETALEFTDAGDVLVIWASTREILNIYQARACGCDIITLTPTMFEKAIALELKSLIDFSIETAAMFDRDAKAAGLFL